MSIGGIYRKLNQLHEELQGPITQQVRDDVCKKLNKATSSVKRLQGSSTELFSQTACLDLLHRISEMHDQVYQSFNYDPACQSNLYSLGIGAAEVDIDEISALFDTARLFFEGKSARESLKAFRTLPQSCLIQFHHHMKILNSDASRPLDYPKETAKALIKIAHEISNSPSDYYSDDQIREMIQDLNSLS